MDLYLVGDMVVRASQAVEDNARHCHDSLWNLLDSEFPDATDEEIEDAIRRVL